jgi:hypothetical protein
MKNLLGELVWGVEISSHIDYLEDMIWELYIKVRPNGVCCLIGM